ARRARFRTPPRGPPARPARRGSRRTAGRSCRLSRRHAPLTREFGQVLLDQRAVLRGVEVLPEEPRRGGERQVDGLPAQRVERAVALALDLGAGAGHQLVCLLACLLLDVATD